MPKLKKFAWLVLLPAVLAMLVVACGGDDDDKDSSGSDDPTATATERTEENGDDSGDNDDNNNADDDDKDRESGGSLPSGNDERYVTDVCSAFDKYLSSLSDVFKNLDPQKIAEDPEGFLASFIEGLEAARDQLKAANPPGDVREWHESLVAAFDQMIEGMQNEAGDFVDEFDVPEMPAKAQERLGRIAANNAACKSLEARGGSLFGSFDE